MPYTYGTSEWEEAYQKKVQERSKDDSKPFVYFSPEWMGAWENLLQGDATYKEAAKDWEGDISLHVQKNPDLGVDVDIYLLMELWHGDCKSLRFVPEEAAKKAPYIITGTIERWISVGKKELDPVKGMMQGKLKLKGELPPIVRAVKAAIRLVETSAEVGGRFPDELDGDDLEGFRSMVNELTNDFSLK